jgi:hypothetical protein
LIKKLFFSPRSNPKTTTVPLRQASASLHSTKTNSKRKPRWSISYIFKETILNILEKKLFAKLYILKANDKKVKIFPFWSSGKQIFSLFRVQICFIFH